MILTLEIDLIKMNLCYSVVRVEDSNQARSR